MKIIKISERMFDTYGMEDLIFKSFKRNHDGFIKKNKDSLQQIQKEFSDGKFLVIGKMQIGKLLEKIISKHGSPKSNDYPKEVYFGLVGPNNRFVNQKNMSAFFLPANNHLYIVKVATDILNVSASDSGLTNTLHHELQHLIRRIYRGNTKSKNYEVGTPEYYSSPKEAQAYCADIAKNALEACAHLTGYRCRNWSPEKILSQISEWRKQESIDNSFKVFGLNALYGSIKRFEEKRNDILTQNPDIKQQYIYYTYRNFVGLYNRYLDDLETKTKNQIEKQPISQVASVIKSQTLIPPSKSTTIEEKL